MTPDTTEPRNQRDITWSLVDRQAGPRPLPDWIKGVHVNWFEGFSNGPEFWFFVSHDIGDWAGKKWRKEGNYYRAYHPDGFVEQHAHDGAVRPTKLKAWRSADGTMSQYRGEGNGSWVEGDFNATTQQQGYCGRHYWLKMEDGTDLVLRGPWHTSPPDGYDAASIVTPKYSGNRFGAKWYERCTPVYGLSFRRDLVIDIFSRFQAHLPLAIVTSYGRARIEPFRDEWGKPKGARIPASVAA